MYGRVGVHSRVREARIPALHKNFPADMMICLPLRRFYYHIVFFCRSSSYRKTLLPVVQLALLPSPI